MNRNSIHVYCYFDAPSMSLPFGRPENYRRARELAINLVGENDWTGRDIDPEEVFFLRTREQLDALFDLQRECRAQFPADFEP